MAETVASILIACGEDDGLAMLARFKGVPVLASYTEEVVKALAQESGWPFSVEAAARKLRLIK